VPVAGDYLRSGRAQVAVFRDSTGEWLIRREGDAPIVIRFGAPGDRPVPADYLGLGCHQIAVYRPSSGRWIVRTEDGRAIPIQWGAPDDIPVPGDYLGQGHAQIAVFRPSTGQWIIRAEGDWPITVTFGAPGDQPVPADYFNRGRDEIAVYQPATATWRVRRDPLEDLTIYRPITDARLLRRHPLDGLTIYRPITDARLLRWERSNALAERFPIFPTWIGRTSEETVLEAQFGEPGDVPLPTGFADALQEWRGSQSGILAPLATVARSAEEWEALWSRVRAGGLPTPAMPKVDFSREMVIAVFAGECPTGGYTITIEELAVWGNELQVLVRQAGPPAGAITTQVVTYPYHLVVVPSSSLPVRFLASTPDNPVDQAGSVKLH
jgi:hypothetical protein